MCSIYMLCILIFIYIISQHFYAMIYEICLFTRLGVECVRVGHVANLCVTHLGMMHLT
jgi:hypothetical protein